MSPRVDSGNRNGREIPNRWLTSRSDPGSHYKVKMNHAYFDAAKLRTSTQLITLRAPANGFGEDRQQGDCLREAFSQIDLAAVRKLLD